MLEQLSVRCFNAHSSTIRVGIDSILDSLESKELTLDSLEVNFPFVGLRLDCRILNLVEV